MAEKPPRSRRVETLNYQVGGFHPVHLGDLFKKDRYKIIHKLGHGGFATVWLVRDTVRNRYAALKILAARLSSDCPEVEILRRLKSSTDHPGKAYVMSMLDHFWISGPNGKHLGVVSEVAGPTIKQFNDSPGLTPGSRRLKACVARKVALQAVEGLAYIHSTGTVHGDFTSANILLQLVNIDAWTEEEIYERLGEPQMEELYQGPGLPETTHPRYTVNSISMKEVDPRWLSGQIMIIDFGIAFLTLQSSLDIGTPKNYCAPEFLFQIARGVGSDIWALGCTVFEIRTGAGLFQFERKPSRDEILMAMVKLLGPLPQKWWDEWKKGQQWYNTETKAGGGLENTGKGTLLLKIMNIGLHDGKPMAPLKPKDRLHKLETVEEEGVRKRHFSEEEQDSTARLVALVSELSTSEAAEVLAIVNADRSRSNSGKSNEGSPNKNDSGSSSSNAKANSGSSNAKSGEKSISSEGLSTGVATGTGAISGAEDGTGQGEIEQTQEGKTSKTLTTIFLEEQGVRISTKEADELEHLLRKALSYLPEDRLSPSALAKFRWCLDDFDIKEKERPN